MLKGISMHYINAGANETDIITLKSCFFMIQIHNMCKVEYEFVRPCFSEFVEQTWHTIYILIRAMLLESLLKLTIK